jgi:hypothetical protein
MDEILLRGITLVGQRVAPSTPFRYLFSWWLDGDGLRSVGSVEMTVGANHLAFEVGTDVAYVASLCTMASGGRLEARSGCAANFGCDASEFATLTSRQSWLMLAAPFHVAAFE